MCNCMEDRLGQESLQFQQSTPGASEANTEPMVVDNPRLSQAEQQRWLTQDLCLYSD